MRFQELQAYYKGKRVFVTGNTGFKGSWLCFLLNMLGAEVYGYARKASMPVSAFSILQLEENVHSAFGDIRDYSKLEQCVREARPDVVFHLSAQALVRESYQCPRETYETNVMGTVNILEAVRQCKNIASVLNITTDKVYENREMITHAFLEDEKLDGYDPYSNSKSCSDLVTHSYIKSFFSEANSPAVSTARAGNVIGGGDFARDRIIPDCVRAAIDGRDIEIRNPLSVRPYQHVLESLSAYLQICMEQDKCHSLSGFYNVGPDREDCITTGRIADLFVDSWGGTINWINRAEKGAPHEAYFLTLDCNKIKTQLNWKPKWHAEEAVKRAVDWYKAWVAGQDMREFTRIQIEEFFGSHSVQ